MQRVFLRSIPIEIAALGLIEGALCFGAVYALISAALSLGAAPALLDMLPHTPAGLAAAVTLTTTAAGAAIGLYRFDTCMNQKRLPTTCGLAAAVAFSALLIVGRGPADGLSASRALFLAAMLVTWIATVMFIRLIYRNAAAFNGAYPGRIDLDSVTADTLLTGPGFAATRFGFGAAVKRVIDVAVAGSMLIAVLPLLVLTGMVIAADSPGPVFYSHIHVGRLGKPFKLHKFRSMVTDAEAAANPRWARENDSRITRVGRFIRATHIDELPQLLNVLAGEMSMVGPTPERPHFAEQLSRVIPLYWHRTYVKPGLTGWAQVNVPHGASIGDAREKLAYDLYYAKNQSIVLDAIILLSTIRVVLFRDGVR